MLAKRIGANIKAARKAHNVSLQRLAAKIDPPTTYQHLSRLEQGADALDFGWVERIAAALGVDPMGLIAPELIAERPPAFRLDEQAANEVARALTLVAREGEEPENGTVQVVALALQELLRTFLEDPEAARDPKMARLAANLVGRRYVPVAN